MGKEDEGVSVWQYFHIDWMRTRSGHEATLGWPAPGKDGLRGTLIPNAMTQFNGFLWNWTLITSAYVMNPPTNSLMDSE